MRSARSFVVLVFVVVLLVGAARRRGPRIATLCSSWRRRD
jgi:hypothetical protein